jgi:hypothetical protein
MARAVAVNMDKTRFSMRISMDSLMSVRSANSEKRKPLVALTRGSFMVLWP